MKLPNYDNAVIPQDKIDRHLLSMTHRDGRSKAKFFLQFGFSATSWQALAEALSHHASAHDVTTIEDSPFGTRYIIEGIILAPDGRTPLIRSIWFIETGENFPRFVTAYPIRRRTS